MSAGSIDSAKLDGPDLTAQLNGVIKPWNKCPSHSALYPFDWLWTLLLRMDEFTSNKKCLLTDKQAQKFEINKYSDKLLQAYKNALEWGSEKYSPIC